jgi:hypothetical protein
LPSRDPAGDRRLTNPALALDLHYLISAYSGADLHGEILLGYAMQLLHETPVLSREAIRTALNPSPPVGADLPPALRALAASGLESQVEQIRIVPKSLDNEEMSKLWTATQSHLRPSAAYLIGVVLIEATEPLSAPLPVLSRGGADPATGRERGVEVISAPVSPLPVIERIHHAGGQPAALLGRAIDLEGRNLDGGARRVRLTNDRFSIAEELVPTGGSSPDRIRFVIPVTRSADFPVGAYQAGARLRPPGEPRPRETNRLALTLAPEILGLPTTVTRDAAGSASFTLGFRPALRLGQHVVLVLGEQEVAPRPFVPPTTSLDFVIPDAPVGRHLARLRIDGIDSPIINYEADPPVFLNQRIRIT